MGTRRIHKVEPFELAPEEVAAWEAEIQQAEQELANPAMHPAHVTLRWTRGPLELVKRAARLHGVPYQTYLKEAAVQRALADLALAEKVGA